VTKVFTATLAAYLEVVGAIGPLNQILAWEYLGNPNAEPPDNGVNGNYWWNPANQTGVTLFQFATQTSGMPDEPTVQRGQNFSELLFEGAFPGPVQYVWWNSPSNQQAFQSDEKYWIYSSAGFVTLGFAVQGAAYTASQRNSKLKLPGTYPALLQQEMLNPIKMPFTFGSSTPPDNATLAWGYNKKHGPALPVLNAQDLKSTAADMYNLLEYQYGAMKSQATNQKMDSLEQAAAMAGQVQISSPLLQSGKIAPFNMRYGWQIQPYTTKGGTSLAYLEKNGATSSNGFSCWVGLTTYGADVPPVGIALMTNQVGTDPDPTAIGILRQILDALA
jgi:CubicO group peptidase (beta-lactamase class C family)